MSTIKIKSGPNPGGEEDITEGPPRSFIELAFAGDDMPGYGDEFPSRVGDCKIRMELQYDLRSRVSLPLGASSFDQVLITNVFGDPETPTKFKDELLAEAHRIVVTGGFVVAKEALTPEIAQEYLAQQDSWQVTRIDHNGSGSQWQGVGPLYGLHKDGEALFFVDLPLQLEPSRPLEWADASQGIPY